MLSYKWCICTLFVAIFSLNFNTAATQPLQLISKFIVVDKLGRGDFTSIQDAINSIPSPNNQWIRIDIKPGVYRERVLIPRDKPFIFLNGSGRRNTYIIWNGHEDIAEGATFSTEANHTLALEITFSNSYNYFHPKPMGRAVAARIQGDQSVFYRCRFMSLQDTLWDSEGRHYFKGCTIRGAVDFIFGAGQSLYESCVISVAGEALDVGEAGYITAQGRGVPNDESGFVFDHCKIVGNGKAFLGRPWRSFARVLFYDTFMSEVVVPEGWSIWDKSQQKNQLELSEYGSRGPGAHISERVEWANKIGEEEANRMASVSFIDTDGWVNTAFDIFGSVLNQ